MAIQGEHPDSLGHLATDSRKVGPGDVFIAVKGFQSDGHQFLAQVARQGASAAIVEQFDDEVPITQVKVANTRRLTGILAHAFAGNPEARMEIAGVTGTNGKTTVATLVYQVLRKLGHPSALLGTVATLINDEKHGSRLTTPDSLELADIFNSAAEAGCRFASMEVSSHALDQHRTSGLNYAVAGFTNLSHDHLDYHKTVAGYATAKKLLFDGLSENAVAIVNTDDPQGEFLVRDCRAEIRRYGFVGDQGDSILENNSKGILIEVDGVTIKSPLIGEFNAYNLALAYHISRALGCTAEDTVTALAEAKGAPGRMEKLAVESSVPLPVILVDFAHTPDALKNVLKTLREVKQAHQTVHVVFGAGGDRDAAKRPVMASHAEELADYITVTSDNPRSEDPDAILDDIFRGFTQTDGVIREADRKTAIIKAIQRADRDAIVLIAGKGHETHQEIKGIHHHFDDKAVAIEALQSLEASSMQRRAN